MVISGINTVCPLCQSDDLTLVEQICPDQLTELYRRRFGLAIADHFRGVRLITLCRCKVCSLMYFHPPVAGSHEFYTHLNKFNWYYLAEKSEYRTAASLIPAGARVLDVGCGEGKFAKLINSSSYVGLEMNLAIMNDATESGPTILPELVGDHSRRRHEWYDVVCIFQVLEHVVDVNSFIEDCLRCLRPGGLLIVSVPAADSFVSQTVNGILNLPPHHLTWWPDAALDHLAQKFCLAQERLIHEPLEKIHYRWFSSNWAYNLSLRLVGSKPRLLNSSITHQILSVALLPLVLVRWLTLLLLPSSIVGHSVVAVYRKGNPD